MHRLYTQLQKIGTIPARWPKTQQLFVWSCLMLGLLFFVSSNKLLLLAAALCVVGLYWIFRNTLLAVLYAYMLFLTIPAGKSLLFPLAPAYLVSYNIPFTASVTITVSNFFSCILLYFTIRNVIFRIGQRSSLRVGISDFFVGFFLLTVSIASAFSTVPLLSFVLTAQMMGFILIYYIIRAHNLERWVVSIMPPLFSALCIFEGGWSVLQMINHGKLGRAIESGIDPVLFDKIVHAASEDPSFFRMQGTFNHPNYLGYFLAIIIPVLISFSLSKKTVLFNKYISAVGVIVGFFGLILSGSRLSWMMLAAAILILFGNIRIRSSLHIHPDIKRLYLYWMIIITVLFPVFVVRRMGQFVATIDAGGGFQFRWFLLQQGFTIFSQHPWGIGLGTYPFMLLKNVTIFTFPPTDPHNLLAQIFISTGVLGGISFCCFLALVIKHSLADLSGNSTTSFFIRSAGMVSVLVLLSLSMAYPVLTEQPVIALLWILLPIVNSRKDII
jgi:hypothetical protein